MTKIDAAIEAISADDLVLAPCAVATLADTGEIGGEISWYVIGHGTFTADFWDYRKARKMSRKALLARVLAIYEGCSYHGDRGDKVSHWRGYHKRDLALIVASCL